MLAVVLVPLLVMLVACSLERFEAKAVPIDPPRRITRAQRPSAAAAPAVTTAEDATTPARHLSLVPAVAPVADEGLRQAS